MIHADNLIFSYDYAGAPSKALDDVTFTVKPGEFVAILGHNGCGKSTLGKCMMRLTDLTDGQVLFTGKDISRQSCRTLRNNLQRMQMIFQPPLFQL